MKIIFLDVDGVLNNAPAFEKTVAAGLSSIETLDEECIKRLRTLVDACWPTTTAIVLSSSWRFSPDLVQVLEAKLRQHGLAITSQTTKQGTVRGEQIAQWLKDRPQVTDPEILILDDDSDMLEEQLPFFVQTSMKTGLTDEHVQAAAKILGIQLPGQ